MVVALGAAVALGTAVVVGVRVAVGGVGVDVGIGVAVPIPSHKPNITNGHGVGVAVGVTLGPTVAVGVGVAAGVGTSVGSSPPQAAATRPKTAMTTRGNMNFRVIYPPRPKLAAIIARSLRSITPSPLRSAADR